MKLKKFRKLKRIVLDDTIDYLKDLDLSHFEDFEDLQDMINSATEDIDKCENVHDLIKFLDERGMDYEDALEYLFEILVD